MITDDPYNVRDMTEKELLDAICGLNTTAPLHHYAVAEMHRRENLPREQKAGERHKEIRTELIQLKKPHWSLTPAFIVACLAMLFAAIAAWPVFRGWFQPSPPAYIDSSSQSPRPHSETTTQGGPQK